MCGVLKIICVERVESTAGVRYNISRHDYRRLCGREAIMMSRSVKTNKQYFKTDEVFAVRVESSLIRVSIEQMRINAVGGQWNRGGVYSNPTIISI